MNPRQRRGVLLMILAGIGSIVVFVSVVGYVGDVRAEVGVKTEVLQLRQAVPAYTEVRPEMLQRVRVPRKWTPRTMVGDPAQLKGKVAAADLPAGSYLQQGMLVPAPDLQPGQREIAIMIDAETGVAGKVQEGMLVDIYATYQTTDGAKQTSCAARIVKSAKVIHIGGVTTQRDDKNAQQTDSVVPITFALSASDSLKLTREESFADKIRLALIGGSGLAPDDVRLAPVCQTVPAR
ncbi:Flp pilus assembly protein CpaB [Actinomadura rayongensis]|uniref:Flp pilus assembly protein CpaB n=1 Tax=Actinomadura rayongensis TaxID=1429076 RepID=A0A6I4W882_9ACTN|nr:Flp pilus assembly protein CpaB [Actinomadura rayongensis]MXQ62942.1 Flp pilus assembly protein CpaB [Actinomadura rayongensis]